MNVTPGSDGNTVQLWVASFDITDAEENDDDGKYFLVRSLPSGQRTFLRVCSAADMLNYPVDAVTDELACFRTNGISSTVHDSAELLDRIRDIPTALTALEVDFVALYSAEAESTEYSLRKYHIGDSFGTWTVSVKETTNTWEVSAALPVMTDADLNTMIEDGVFVTDDDIVSSLTGVISLSGLAGSGTEGSAIKFRLNRNTDVLLADVVGHLVYELEETLTLADVDDEQGS